MGTPLPSPASIEYATHPSGLVFCRNRSGLIFFFVTEAPGAKGQAQALHAPSIPPPQVPPKAATGPLQVVPVQEVAWRQDAPATVAEALGPSPIRPEKSAAPLVEPGLTAPPPAPAQDHAQAPSAKVAMHRLQAILPHRDGRLAPGEALATEGREAAPRSIRPPGTGALPEAPSPGTQAPGGWFRRLFSPRA